MHSKHHSMHNDAIDGEHMADCIANMESRLAPMKQVHSAKQALLYVSTDEQKETMKNLFPGGQD